MDPITNLLIQLGVAGGALAVLRWFAGRVLDLFAHELRSTAAAVRRIEPMVDDLHAKFCPPPPPRLYPEPETDTDPGDHAA